MAFQGSDYFNSPSSSSEAEAMYFEGVEKKIILHFNCQKLKDSPLHSLRNIPDRVWEKMLKRTGCQVLSKLENFGKKGMSSEPSCTAYLLSESSLFVYDYKILLKTCGKTVPLLFLEELHKISDEYFFFLLPTKLMKDCSSGKEQNAHPPPYAHTVRNPHSCSSVHTNTSNQTDSLSTHPISISREVFASIFESVAFVRLAYMFPRFQSYPHRNFEEEVDYLSSYFSVNDNFVLQTGKQNSVYVFLARGASSDGWKSFSFDEFLMRDIFLDSVQKFCGSNGWPSSNEVPTPGERITLQSTPLEPLKELLPMDSKLDQFWFDLCGYSCNVLDDGVYMNVHISPEDGVSYASFEVGMESSDECDMLSPPKSEANAAGVHVESTGQEGSFSHTRSGEPTPQNGISSHKKNTETTNYITFSSPPSCDASKPTVSTAAPTKTAPSQAPTRVKSSKLSTHTSLPLLYSSLTYLKNALPRFGPRFVHVLRFKSMVMEDSYPTFSSPTSRIDLGSDYKLVRCSEQFGSWFCVSHALFELRNLPEGDVSKMKSQNTRGHSCVAGNESVCVLSSYADSKGEAGLSLEDSELDSDVSDVCKKANLISFLRSNGVQITPPQQMLTSGVPSSVSTVSHIEGGSTVVSVCGEEDATESYRAGLKNQQLIEDGEEGCLQNVKESEDGFQSYFDDVLMIGSESIAPSTIGAVADVCVAEAFRKAHINEDVLTESSRNSTVLEASRASQSSFCMAEKPSGYTGWSINTQLNMERDVLTEFIKNNRPDNSVMLVNLQCVLHQWRRWKRELPMVEPFYAVKCNSDPLFLDMLAFLGGKFDCATHSEILSLAGLIGKYRSGDSFYNSVILSNPCKQLKSIKAAKEMGVKRLVFDNEDELYKIAAHYQDAELILRIRTDDRASQCPMSLKFGAPSSTWEKLYTQCIKLGLSVSGVSFHVGSGCGRHGAFRSALDSARDAIRLGIEMGFSFTMLDIGGGFPGEIDYTLQTSHPSFEELAAEIRLSLSFLLKDFPSLYIVAEPGRYFASASHTLAVKIFAKKSPLKTLPAVSFEGVSSVSSTTLPSLSSYDCLEMSTDTENACDSFELEEKVGDTLCCDEDKVIKSSSGSSIIEGNVGGMKLDACTSLPEDQQIYQEEEVNLLYDSSLNNCSYSRAIPGDSRVLEEQLLPSSTRLQHSSSLHTDCGFELVEQERSFILEPSTYLSEGDASQKQSWTPEVELARSCSEADKMVDYHVVCGIPSSSLESKSVCEDAVILGGSHSLSGRSGQLSEEIEVEEPSSISDRKHCYYINDSLYGVFNCVLYDHTTLTPELLIPPAHIAMQREILASENALEVSSQICDDKAAFKSTIFDGKHKVCDDRDNTQFRRSHFSYCGFSVDGNDRNLPSNVSSLGKEQGLPLYPSILFGQTCDGFDCVAENVNLPLLHVDDWLMFRNMGAYSVAAASSFNGFGAPLSVYKYLDI